MRRDLEWKLRVIYIMRAYSYYYKLYTLLRVIHRVLKKK